MEEVEERDSSSTSRISSSAVSSTLVSFQFATKRSIGRRRSASGTSSAGEEVGGGETKDELTFDSSFDVRETRVLSVHPREIDRRRRELMRREDGRWCGGEHRLDAMMVVWREGRGRKMS